MLMFSLGTLLSLLLAWAQLAHALSADQIQQVFGSEPIRGATKRLPRFNLSVVTNSSKQAGLGTSLDPADAVRRRSCLVRPQLEYSRRFDRLARHGHRRRESSPLVSRIQPH
jgi:hypothetical protein